MKHIIKYVFYPIIYVRFLPHIILLYTHPNRNMLRKDVDQWIKIIMNLEGYSLKKFIWLLRFVPEYRNVFYLRIDGFFIKLLRVFVKGRELLFINMKSANVGEGLVIQHGHSTIIEAISIGNNCQIWHNVTIGTNISHSGNKAIIGNNVKICAGAIVLGNIIIGNNVTIGAGSVVVKSIPDNCTVVGNPAKIIRKDGMKMNSYL